MNTFKKSLALIIALAMVLTTFGMTIVSASSFNDIEGHWAQSLISKWSDKGTVNGYEDGSFAPDANMTRAELAKIIATSKNYTAYADINFNDVNGDEWFVNDLKKCVAQSVIGGYDDGSFRPDAYVTREAAATMFQRAYNVNAIGLLNFVDNDNISEWAKDAVTVLVGAKVINGYEDGTFLPHNSITRAEVVKILDGITAASPNDPQSTSSGSGGGTVGIGNLGGGGGGGGGNPNVDKNSWTVTMNANGGSFSDGRATKSLSVAKNGVIGSKAVSPAREGYIFDGWYTSQDAADNLISSKKWNVNNDSVSKNMTLYAGWYSQTNLIVSFETNGGTPTIERQFVEGGNKIASPTVEITRKNYTFAGWYTDYAMKTAYDFDNDVIKKDTTLYAKWIVDPSFDGQEITLPTDTTGSFQTGKVQAAPSKVLSGETVVITITPPSGFEVKQVPTITYTSSSTTGGTASVSSVKDLGDMSYSFVMPSDVVDGTIKINPKFEVALATPPPTERPAPTPTVDPDAPTPTPIKLPTWEFSKGGFEELTEFSGTVDGLTLDKGSAAISSAGSTGKTFDGTGYKYVKVCKIGKNPVSFNVEGPCKITIDAVTANNNSDREYVVTAGSEQIGSTICKGNEAISYECTYAGAGDKITITPRDGINIYGIWIEYSGDITVPTSEPTPTVNPNIRYNISISDQIANGSVVVDNGIISSDKIQSYTWSAVDNIPSGWSSGVFDMFGDGKSIHNINGTDDSAGTLTMYESVSWYEHTVAETGEKGIYIRGENNGLVDVPVTNEPSSCVYSVKATNDGYFTLNLYVYANKTFKLYDNMEQIYIEDFSTPAENFYTFTFPCEKDAEYYFWADGSRAGVKNITYSTGILNAKAGDLVTVNTTPDEGYKAGSVFTNPETKVKEEAANKYTFAMPASDVNVGASFISSTAQEYTASAVKPENGTVRLEKGVSTADVELQSKNVILNASDNFLMADQKGGKWIVSSDGTLEKTAIADYSDIGGNATEKMLLSDKAVQYVLENEIKSGTFELSYDFYDDNTAAAGRSFRTYLDNTAHAYNETTGQATEFGSDGAFFHMMDVSGNVYVTKDVADIAGKAAAGVQVGDKALDANKWYRVVIKGELGSAENVIVSYYLHGTDGAYAPDNVSKTPELTTLEAAYTDDRTPTLSQIKFMRTAGGNLYYDNITLTAEDGTPETDVFKLKAFDGETVNIIATPDEGYLLNSVSVKDTSGKAVAVSNTNSFVMPKSDVDVEVVFGKEAPATPQPTSAPEPTVDPNGTVTKWQFSLVDCSEILEGTDPANTITAKTDYNGLTLYGSTSKGLAIDSAAKTVEGISFPGRIKLGGLGTIDGDNSSRAMSFVPDAFGTVRVYYAHASSADKPPRSLAIQQSGNIVTKSVDGGSNTSFTAYAWPGAPVYVYGLDGVNVYAVEFTTASGYVDPPAPPEPTTEPVATEQPAPDPTTEPVATEQPAPDPTTEPTEPTTPPVIDTEVIFESSFDDEEVGASINTIDSELGGMKLVDIDSTSSVEIVDGNDVGAEGSKVAKILKLKTDAKSEQLKLFWSTDGEQITNKMIVTAVVKNSAEGVGTDM